MIQYPKNTHITLPSVSGGFGTTKILRDPPKSIHTRFIPKVGDTNKITEWIGDSGDRICEGVKVYARGVNPMVSVDYSNYGSNGGQVRYRGGARGTDQSGISSLGQAYLPYRIMKDGAFRPPIIPLEQQLPLSRLPRLTTSETTNPGSNMTDGLIRLNQQVRCGTDMREIRKELINLSCTSTPTLNIQNPFTEPYETKNMVHDSVLDVYANTNPYDKRYTLGTNSTPDRGINHNLRYATVVSKPYKNIQVNGLQTQLGNQPISIHERVKGNCVTNASAQGNINYIHKIQDLERTLPTAQAYTNQVRGGDLNNFINSREYRNLPQKVSRGGFENNGFQQTFDRETPSTSFNTCSNEVYRNAAKQLEGRFGPPANF